MPRREGSGLSRPTSTAVEELTAAVFEGRHDVSSYVRRIDQEALRGRTQVRGADVERWLRRLADQVGLDVVEAVSPSPDQLGDVRLILRDGTLVWIEVKAQTTKGFADLLQADWVRDQTDALRWLSLNEPTVRRLLSPWALDELSTYSPELQFGGLEFSGLWLADIALLPDRQRRSVARVTTVDDLLAFMGTKYLLHVSSEGARMVRLDQFPMVDAVLSGQRVQIDVQSGSSCDARVWVSARGAPRRGKIDFIYYVGYQGLGVIGRHKLHPGAVSRSRGLVTAS